VPRFTPAVVRTLDILELFLQGGSLNAADVVRGTGLPRSTVHELLTTLTSRDYLTKDDSGQYSLGVALLHLGNAYAERFDLLGAANEAAKELAGASKETTSVAIRQGAQVFYLAKVERRTVMQTPSNIGQRLPASCTALGKALLSAVPDEALESLFPEPEHLPRIDRAQHRVPRPAALRARAHPNPRLRDGERRSRSLVFTAWPRSSTTCTQRRSQPSASPSPSRAGKTAPSKSGPIW